MLFSDVESFTVPSESVSTNFPISFFVTLVISVSWVKSLPSVDFGFSSVSVVVVSLSMASIVRICYDLFT